LKSEGPSNLTQVKSKRPKHSWDLLLLQVKKLLLYAGMEVVIAPDRLLAVIPVLRGVTARQPMDLVAVVVLLQATAL
jgi:hypothetical protein